MVGAVLVAASLRDCFWSQIFFLTCLDGKAGGKISRPRLAVFALPSVNKNIAPPDEN
jgi:hypothetical protein